MIIFNRQFKPSVLMILITLVGVSLFATLGFWQLERAAYKQTITDRFQARLNQAFKPFELAENWAAIEYQPTILRGHYDNQGTLLLDNRTHQGRVGYHVLSPFTLANGDLVLVNRGWVSMGNSRQQLPLIKSPPPAQTIKGHVIIPDSDSFRMGEVSLNTYWPQVIPFIDIDALQASFDHRLLPIIVWLAPEQSDFYERNWQPIWQLPEKSKAYAVQWFAFAAIALMLFFILNLRPLS